MVFYITLHVTVDNSENENSQDNTKLIKMNISILVLNLDDKIMSL